MADPFKAGPSSSSFRINTPDDEVPSDPTSKISKITDWDFENLSFSPEIGPFTHSPGPICLPDDPFDLANFESPNRNPQPQTLIVPPTTEPISQTLEVVSQPQPLTKEDLEAQARVAKFYKSRSLTMLNEFRKLLYVEPSFHHEPVAEGFPHVFGSIEPADQSLQENIKNLFLNTNLYSHDNSLLQFWSLTPNGKLSQRDDVPGATMTTEHQLFATGGLHRNLASQRNLKTFTYVVSLQPTIHRIDASNKLTTSIMLPIREKGDQSFSIGCVELVANTKCQTKSDLLCTQHQIWPVIKNLLYGFEVWGFNTFASSCRLDKEVEEGIMAMCVLHSICLAQVWKLYEEGDLCYATKVGGWSHKLSENTVYETYSSVCTTFPKSKGYVLRSLVEEKNCLVSEPNCENLSMLGYSLSHVENGGASVVICVRKKDNHSVLFALEFVGLTNSDSLNLKHLFETLKGVLVGYVFDVGSDIVDTRKDEEVVVHILGRGKGVGAGKEKEIVMFDDDESVDRGKAKSRSWKGCPLSPLICGGAESSKMSRFEQKKLKLDLDDKVTIKARYKNLNARFDVSMNSGSFAAAKLEIETRFQLLTGMFKVEYTDSDGDPILMTRDADLLACFYQTSSSPKERSEHRLILVTVTDVEGK